MFIKLLLKHKIVCIPIEIKKASIDFMSQTLNNNNISY